MTSSPGALFVDAGGLEPSDSDSSTESSGSDPDLQPALQAAGHPGAQQGEGLFVKPSTRTEISFYEQLTAAPTGFAEFVPEFMGTLTSSEDSQPLIVLEDLCTGFSAPSVADFKLGAVLWDAHASPDKKQRLEGVSRATTSGALGFRIAGMSVVQADGERKAFDKAFGRAATPQTILTHIAQFWPQLDTNDYMFSIASGILAQLQALEAELRKTPIEMHSASVLVVYEGNAKELERKLEHQDDLDPTKDKLLEVKMIDFAHTYASDRPDADVLRGLDSLISCIDHLLQ